MQGNKLSFLEASGGILQDMASPTEEIKEKLDVAEVLKEYIELIPAGRNFKARCPFHNEKTPSFVVSPDRGSFKCFGCGEGGDIFSFVMKYEHVEFPDALRMLADKAGVELKKQNPNEERISSALYRAHEEAVLFYKEQLKQSKLAQEYLKERGITGETALFFDIGWAPVERNALALYLRGKGFSAQELVRSGLVLSGNGGDLYDRFRARVMFPIHSHIGKVIGFTGRIHPDHDTGKLGKYINSPETPIYNKSKVLYAYAKNKQAIRELGRTVLVEGQVDAVACWQSGIKNVVALSGTALTEQHVQTLKRSAPVLDLAFDKDDAGWQAAERAAHLALQHDLETNLITWPGEGDPADLMLEDPKLLLEAVQKPVPVITGMADHLLEEGRITVGAARTALKAIHHSGTFLPQEEVENRLNKWR